LEAVFSDGSAPRLYNENLLRLLSSSESRRRRELSWSELLERRQLVSSARELTAEGKYQLEPASSGRHEMVVSLRGREPGSRGTPAVGSFCQATLVKTVKSLV
jgi:hypothetical protein